MSSSKEKGVSRGLYLNGLGLMMMTSGYCPYTEVVVVVADDDDDDDDRGVNLINP